MNQPIISVILEGQLCFLLQHKRRSGGLTFYNVGFFFSTTAWRPHASSLAISFGMIFCLELIQDSAISTRHSLKTFLQHILVMICSTFITSLLLSEDCCIHCYSNNFSWKITFHIASFQRPSIWTGAPIMYSCIWYLTNPFYLIPLSFNCHTRPRYKSLMSHCYLVLL